MNCTKQVSYAYPTSTAAEDFGFGKTGCYAVEFLHDATCFFRRIPRGFATAAEAFDYADTLPEEYDRYSLRRDGSMPWLETA